jgi:DNA repair ATPase RecN
MGKVAEFERELKQRSRPRLGSWHKVDMHNHTPASDDYKYRQPDTPDRLAEQILKMDLAVVMFTDHGRLPELTFVDAIEKRCRRLIVRGAELNVFVDAWDKPAGKVARNLFFHLLVGFDPHGEQSPDYWLTHLYRECRSEEREAGGKKIKGISASLEEVCEVLRQANALVIPAHLHSTADAFRSRSIDDIFADREFLEFARQRACTALEVTSLKTGAFFDGKHVETDGLHKSCIQSSDSHEPAELGWRPTYVEMETPSYQELKASLELPFRVSLSIPSEPPSYVVGLHVQGEFLKDMWITFSPHCNVLIGVKGSGKTSMLECLRFVLGAEIPTSRKDEVDAHLKAILGPAGRVRALVKRADGAKILVERSIAEEGFLVTFEDERQERISRAESLLFPTYILGWHEIEQVATDPNVRRLYLDAISDRVQVRQLEERAALLGKQIRDKHDLAASRYSSFQTIHHQVNRLQELRRGLQQLTDANLVQLRDEYQVATDHRQALRVMVERVANARDRASAHSANLLGGIEAAALEGPSPLDNAVVRARDLLSRVFSTVSENGRKVEEKLRGLGDEFAETAREADQAFAAFAEMYNEKVSALTPEQRRLLETHRVVMEETKDLAHLEAEQDRVKQETEQLLRELMQLCEQVAETLDRRTQLRVQRVSEFNNEVETYGVRLTVTQQQTGEEYQNLAQRYSHGSTVLNELRSNFPDRLAHLCVRNAYGSLLGKLDTGYGRLFEYSELAHFLGLFENDDLRVELRVGKAGQEYSPIDQLSAGQRCTAIFPVLLKLEEGPLVVDQPEDNLDNRHIADIIAPALADGKKSRQMMFTSHNANLVVLSDAEMIAAFESTGSEGRVEECGFLATRDSPITEHVLQILDGGERALELRFRKYGRGAE